MKHIILCADDYGQNAAISQAIIELFNKKRLSATSCLSTALTWSTQAVHLQAFKDQVDVGLHFNLTEGAPLSDAFKTGEFSSFVPVSKLIIQAYLRQLDKKNIKAELTAQLDRFVAFWGQLPDFIDGHQHIHQLPIIREALLAVWEEKLRKTGSYIRCTYSKAFTIKQFIIQLCGAGALKRKLVAHKVPHNRSFLGVYDFSGQFDAVFPHFLQRIRDGGLIMCHPGLENIGEKDAIAAARYREYQYFNSDLFLADCQRYGVQLVRFSD